MEQKIYCLYPSQLSKKVKEINDEGYKVTQIAVNSSNNMVYLLCEKIITFESDSNSL